MAERTSETTRLPGLSFRAQLTLSYAAFVVIVGVALFVVGFLLLRFVPDGTIVLSDGGFTPARSDLLKVFVRYALLALGLLAILGLGGGWLLAGRMLRPLTAVTSAARAARIGTLDQRIALPGRRNELTELADEFDAMLDRVEHSVEEQRRFAANASHELRTPNTVVRTMLEVARADPAAVDLDVLLSRIQSMNERSIALTEALLLLAAADHHQGGGGPVALAPLVEGVVNEAAVAADRAGVSLDLHERDPGYVWGDAGLLRQLAENLVQNAIVHNHEGGAVHVSMTTPSAGMGSVLEVSNTGADLTESTLATFTQPFTRGAGRTRRADARHVGSGLGLAIVSSIARAHGATLSLSPREGGGLLARVGFPATPQLSSSPAPLPE
jgi:two-component system sensor histidine kinase VanS